MMIKQRITMYEEQSKPQLAIREQSALNTSTLSAS